MSRRLACLRRGLRRSSLLRPTGRTGLSRGGTCTLPRGGYLRLLVCSGVCSAGRGGRHGYPLQGLTSPSVLSPPNGPIKIDDHRPMRPKGIRRPGGVKTLRSLWHHPRANTNWLSPVPFSCHGMAASSSHVRPQSDPLMLPTTADTHRPLRDDIRPSMTLI